MLKDTNKEIQMELRKQALQVSNFHNHITKEIWVGVELNPTRDLAHFFKCVLYA